MNNTIGHLVLVGTNLGALMVLRVNTRVPPFVERGLFPLFDSSVRYAYDSITESYFDTFARSCIFYISHISLPGMPQFLCSPPSTLSQMIESEFPTVVICSKDAIAVCDDPALSKSATVNARGCPYLTASIVSMGGLLSMDVSMACTGCLLL